MLYVLYNCQLIILQIHKFYVYTTHFNSHTNSLIPINRVVLVHCLLFSESILMLSFAANITLNKKLALMCGYGTNLVTCHLSTKVGNKVTLSL